jgi:hypothetical protein
VFRVSIVTHIDSKQISIVLTGFNKNSFDEIINNVFPNKMIPGVNILGANSRAQILGHKNCPTLSHLTIIGSFTSMNILLNK